MTNQTNNHDISKPEFSVHETLFQARDEAIKDKIIDESSEEQGEDESSREVLDIDQAVEEAGMGSDQMGPKELKDAEELTINARNG